MKTLVAMRDEHKGTCSRHNVCQWKMILRISPQLYVPSALFSHRAMKYKWCQSKERDGPSRDKESSLIENTAESIRLQIGDNWLHISAVLWWLHYAYDSRLILPSLQRPWAEDCRVYATCCSNLDSSLQFLEKLTSVGPRGEDHWSEIWESSPKQKRRENAPEIFKVLTTIL